MNDTPKRCWRCYSSNLKRDFLQEGVFAIVCLDCQAVVEVEEK